jgi:hypothetical protein
MGRNSCGSEAAAALGREMQTPGTHTQLDTFTAAGEALSSVCEVPLVEREAGEPVEIT